MSEWLSFFREAGVPVGPAASYANTFVDNRITKSMLMDLTKEYLKEMGIGVMGDVIAILKYAKTAYSKVGGKPMALPVTRLGSIQVSITFVITRGNQLHGIGYFYRNPWG